MEDRIRRALPATVTPARARARASMAAPPPTMPPFPRDRTDPAYPAYPGLRTLFDPRRRLETRFVLSVLCILLLSAFDAGSTLYLMAEGTVEEANPFMRHLMDRDPGVFALWKQWVTGACVVVAATLARVPAFGVLEGRVILRLALTGYAILAGWHVFLIALTRIA